MSMSHGPFANDLSVVSYIEKSHTSKIQQSWGIETCYPTRNMRIKMAVQFS